MRLGNRQRGRPEQLEWSISEMVCAFQLFRHFLLQEHVPGIPVGGERWDGRWEVDRCEL